MGSLLNSKFEYPACGGKQILVINDKDSKHVLNIWMSHLEIVSHFELRASKFTDIDLPQI